MKPIYLIGFMGAGKTTVGLQLSDKNGIAFFDTDTEVVKGEETSINHLFSERGEEYFRQCETKVLKGLPVTDAVISTGGGIILAAENKKYMKQTGTVVYLKTTLEETLIRLEGDTSRPLLSGAKQEEAAALFLRRQPIYTEASDMIVNTTGRTINDIVSEIEAGLKL
ncbi:shikimate kinase [Mesobacillus harenae]|uniref:shikimate kinase n=1 Tax=Mesobacillus harenae TaxID=2213203 RepID=UPI001580D893|nr:shikimate kinase [Mesobacillus harenae]